jgi:hypothetical protein
MTGPPGLQARQAGGRGTGVPHKEAQRPAQVVQELT